MFGLFKTKSFLGRLPPCSLDPEMDKVLSKWRDMHLDGKFLIYPVSFFHVRRGLTTCRKLEEWIARQPFLSASLIDLDAINRQRRQLKSDAPGSLSTGMLEEVGVVVRVPPQNILRAEKRGIDYRTGWLKQEYVYSKHRVFGNASPTENTWQEKFSISSPRELLSRTRGKANEVVFTGRPNIKVHLLSTSAVTVHGMVALGHRKSGTPTRVNGELIEFFMRARSDIPLCWIESVLPLRRMSLSGG